MEVGNKNGEKEKTEKEGDSGGGGGKRNG